MSNEIERHLKVAHLYDKVAQRAGEDSGELRALLDGIYNAGKIDGRMTALVEQPVYPAAGEVWQSKTDAEDTVEILSVSPALIVHYLHPKCPCLNPSHAASGHRAATAVYQFTELYALAMRSDRLIEDWQRIVDGV